MRKNSTRLGTFFLLDLFAIYKSKIVLFPYDNFGIIFRKIYVFSLMAPNSVSK